MGLSPQAQAVLQQLEKMSPPMDFATLAGAEEAAYLQRIRGLPRAPAIADVASIDNILIDGSVPARIYRPANLQRGGPVVHYVHGGGWVMGNLDMHDNSCRLIANRAGVAVVSSTYRLAPEHPFPAAADDTFKALSWIAANGAAQGWDASRIAMGGSSAGGNLVASATLRAQAQGGPRIAMQILVYPVIDSTMSTESYVSNARGYLITAEQMAWYWRKYTSSPADRSNPLASPGHAVDLAGLPPALVITAEFDTLRDEGEAYADRLRAAGVEVELHRAKGQIHGFMTLVGAVDDARYYTEMIADRVKERLAN
jgi:acetyl esterase